jgi:hypothetical protein
VRVGSLAGGSRLLVVVFVAFLVGRLTSSRHGAIGISAVEERETAGFFSNVVRLSRFASHHVSYGTVV